ncbi:group 1 glycosyltransferase [Proteus hauseri ATCC 700826]|uniref:Group 1 glycosyltransferase n=1 Tax=Proteus hauseri ATCC 700826 TaxID=1354271 RepID=A0AAJ3HUR8_PROHU|nr:glycosyltransferase [Proteus hauseri]OAT50309.1 group 1 glycosyltransferase [Proteus hauseri ATCC 700826]
MNKKNILFIISSLEKGGPVNQLFELLSKINECSFNITLLSLSSLESNKSRYNDFLKLNIELISLNYDGYNLFKINSEIKEIILQKNINVIISQGFRADISLPKLINQKKISILHNYIYPDYKHEYGLIKSIVMSLLHIYALKKVDTVISVSQSVSEYVKSKYKLTSIYIRNGVKEKEEKNNSFNEKKFINLVYVGNLDKRKNVKTLLKSFDKLDGDFRLRIIGSGPEEELLKKQYSLNKKITFEGYSNHVDNILYESDIFISASTFEGLPMAVLEALSIGIPCILSDIPPHNEIINLNKSFGEIYDFDKDNNLDEKIYSCIEKNNQDIHNNFIKYLSSGRMAKEYIDIIKK